MPLDQSAGDRLRAEGTDAAAFAGPLRFVRAQDAVNFGPLSDKPDMLFPLPVPKLPRVSLDRLHIASAFDFMLPDPEIDPAPVRRGCAPRPDVIPQRRAQGPEKLGYRHVPVRKLFALSNTLIADPIQCRDVLRGRSGPSPDRLFRQTAGQRISLLSPVVATDPLRPRPVSASAFISALCPSPGARAARAPRLPKRAAPAEGRSCRSGTAR